MNKKILSLSLIMALAFGASACRKKSSDEPIKPNPVAPAPSNNGGSTAGGSTAGGSNNGGNGNTTTGENNSGNNNSNGGSTNAGNTNSGNAQESNASVTLTVPAGKSVTINGTTYTGNNQNKIFLDNSFKTLEISGDDLPSLNISGDNLTEVKIKTEMAKLTQLNISNSGKDTKKTIKLDIAAAKNLNSLALADYDLGNLDLKQLTKLKSLTLGALKGQSTTLVSKVELPTDNAIEVLKLQRVSRLQNGIIDFKTLSKLKHFTAISTMIDNFSFPNSTELESIVLNSPTGETKDISVRLENNPNIKRITAWNITITNLSVKNASKFSGVFKPKETGGTTRIRRIEFREVSQASVEQTLQTIVPADLERLTAPGLGLTLGQGVLSKFKQLNSDNTKL